jgi:signal peptidase II
LRRIALAALIVATLAVDQATKAAAREHLQGRLPREYGALTLLYAENRGAFLSLGASMPPLARRVVFDGLVTVGLAVAAWVLLTGRVRGRGDDVALALIVGGGAGNLIDRFRFAGHVTDFVYLKAGPLHTGVFNVADMAITGGVLWLALGWVVTRRTPSRPAPSPSPPPQ